MSQIQTLQKLRVSNKVAFHHQLIEFSKQKEKSSSRLKINDFGSLRLNNSPSRQAYNQFSNIKSISLKKSQMKRFSGSSLSVLSKRQQMPFATLEIYNISSKHSRKPLLSGPLTDRQQYSSALTQLHDESKRPKQPISKGMFIRDYVIGKGGFSKVWKVQMKKNGKTYAMKQMYKAKIIAKKSIHSVLSQRKLLSELNHPFLVNMNYAFQDKQNLFLIMDYLNGGDLRYHMITKRFGETETKFFISCLLLSITYLHDHGIIHRDIKPENLVLESNGYLRLTDLGISNKWKQNNSIDTSGTPGYMAPEVLRHRNHSFVADYFAIGIIVYELMLGRRPYLGNRKEIRQQVMVRQAIIKPQDIPKGWSIQAADFANKLMARNPDQRLGAKGDDQVRKHCWLKQVNWAMLMRKQIKAPFVPLRIQDNYEEYKQQISEDSQIEAPQQNALLLRSKQTQALFEGYSYPTMFQVTKETKNTSQASDSLAQISDDLLGRMFKDPKRHLL